jgi:selenocysteine lyase/cysteine desulfurase
MTALASAEAFLEANPSYSSTAKLDELRERDYSRLDAQGQVYLDYTGAGLYGVSQIEKHAALIKELVLGNPHSSNPASSVATELVEDTRRAVLEFFNASPEEYVAIFTPNATGALKLVGEAYPFGEGDHYLLTFDNHNSVNGIREFARARRARITYVPLTLPDMRIDEGELWRCLDLARPGGHNLFAYPAQSNFSGVQHDLRWIERAQAKGWDVLLDAAAFVPTNRLDLSVWHPDFVSISFYKMFGYPTGVGCLLARRSALARLRRPWFAGGTITVASVQGDRHYLAEGERAYEDGTVNFLSIPAVKIGLEHLQQVGMDVIHERVACLTRWLIGSLLELRHSNGRPVVKLYGPAGSGERGGTVTVNFYDRDGKVIDHRVVEREAGRRKISIRTGCFCNPGGGEVALGLSSRELIRCLPSSAERLSLEDFSMCIDGRSLGAVRASLGLVSNVADVEAYVNFARSFAG